MTDLKHYPLVSIVTPCYNGEKYLNKYFNDILAQDYPNCELIFMDDGSTDKTKEIVDFYRKKVEMKGYSFRYYYHPNIGLGGTINEGVKYITGEYFIWPDCDDGLPPNSISEKVFFLQKHQEFGLVRTNGLVVDENGKTIRTIVSDKNPTLKETDLFENYLFGRGSWLQPGCFMVRTSAFDRSNPDRFVFPTRRGQDWQILLPVMYYFKCGYINQPLYHYYIHPGSLSNSSDASFEKEIRMKEQFEELIIKTIEHMNIPDGADYTKKVKVYYIKQSISTALKYGKKEKAREFCLRLKAINGKCDIKSRTKAFLSRVPFFSKVYRRIAG